MTPLRPRTDLGTHTVRNQPEPRGDIDLWSDDAPLRETVEREGGAAHKTQLASFGAQLGRAVTREQGRLANRFPPELQAIDSGGRRIDEVAFHPAYHALLGMGIAAGYPSIPWSSDGAAQGGHVAHAAMVYLMTQTEPGVCCPMTMTYAGIPALAVSPEIEAEWRAPLLSRRYDPASGPVAGKNGATIGMALTEKQGGSDLRATETRAEPDGSDYRLTGHKWFCSAPMSDAFLSLAHAPGGLTCFLVPRWTPDGERNPVELIRLKDKLGNRSNASAEIEYRRAWARRLGEEGAGIRTVLEMVHHTRLDTAMAPAGLMRAAISEAAWWCRGRSAFGRRLIDQPLMTAVLADLALDWQGALTLGLRVARAFDEGRTEPLARSFARLGVAIAKYWSNKRCPNLVYEAMECLGGAGYVEESRLPLLYREAPLNSIWEGSGNVICLDVLRTIERDPAALEALRADIDAARGADRDFDRADAAVFDRWPRGPEPSEARWFVESLARLLQGALLIRHAPAAIADAFVATRLDAGSGMTAGAWPKDLDVRAIFGRI